MSEYHKIETLYERDKVTFKVDPTKIKNPVYGIIKSWLWTEKVDGTNIRLIFKPPNIRIGGRTDNASIPGDLINNVLTDELKEKSAITFQCPVVLYGEGYGAGIQKPVGAMYSATKKFILFDVLVDGKWWLNQEGINDVAGKLGLDVVPDFGEMTLEAATEIVKNGFNSAINNVRAEGLVGRTIEPLFDKMGRRLIVKLKTKDF